MLLLIPREQIGHRLSVPLVLDFAQRVFTEVYTSLQPLGLSPSSDGRPCAERANGHAALAAGAEAIVEHEVPAAGGIHPDAEPDHVLIEGGRIPIGRSRKVLHHLVRQMSFHQCSTYFPSALRQSV